MNSLVASVIRTIIPAAVGQLGAWLLLAHIVLPQSALDGLSTFLGFLLTAIYYVGVRVLEQQWPYVGILLGLPSSPDTYSKSSAAATAAIPANPTMTAAPVTVYSTTAVPSGVVPDLPATTEAAPVVTTPDPVTLAPVTAAPAQ